MTGTAVVMMWGSVPLVVGHLIDGDDVAKDSIEVLLVYQYVFRIQRSLLLVRK